MHSLEGVEMSYFRPLSVGLVLLAWLYVLGRPATAQGDALRNLAQRVEPDGKATPERLSHYIRCFQDATFQDPRVIAFQVDAQPANDKTIQLSGYIEFPEIREALVTYLGHLGFEAIRDDTIQLPSKQLGDRRFGFVTSQHGLVLTQPNDSAETATDALLGEPLYLLLESTDGFLLCHTGDGYLGFIHSRHVFRVDTKQFQHYQAGKQVRVLRGMAVGDQQLPAGSHLKWIDQTDSSVTIQLPKGDKLNAPVENVDVIDITPALAVERALTTAKSFIGTKYLWGGKTKTGIDCSGLVQTSFAASGFHLPRDSNQQVIIGRLTAARWYRQGLRRGDTLYFLGRPGRITHTGIYLGNDQYIEAVTPTVRISSLNREDANYSRRGDATLAFAKRLVD